MSEEEGKPSRRLSDEQLTEIFREDVKPGLARFTTQASPRMVILGGPQGSRKSTLRPLVAEQLGLTDFVVWDGDDHYAFHPHYDALAQELGAPEAQGLCRPDIEALRRNILEEVHGRRLNIMFVGPYTHEGYTLDERVAPFRDNGYATELAYTALHQALCQVGVMDRHRQALTNGPGYSFLVSLELQQIVFDGVPTIMTIAEERGLVDALHVVDAGGIMFSKHLGADGTWTPSRPAAEVVQEIRIQPWASTTRQDFLQRRSSVATSPGNAEDWGSRLARVDELAAPMLGAEAPMRPSARAARLRSATASAARIGKKAAAPPSGHRRSPPQAPGQESSSGRSR
ncbi:zeta toxin family protein [Streptomyces sp. NPDC054854]